MKDRLPGDQMGTCQQPYIKRSVLWIVYYKKKFKNKKGKKGKEPTFCKIFKHMILRCCVKKQIGSAPPFF